jgi:hypothetical protein
MDGQVVESYSSQHRFDVVRKAVAYHPNRDVVFGAPINQRNESVVELLTICKRCNVFVGESGRQTRTGAPVEFGNGD